MMKKNPKNPVGWFEIYVDDMKRAKKFYETVFKCKFEKLSASNPVMWMFPGSMTGFRAGGNSVLVYFRAADCAVETARAVAAGGRVQKKKASIGEWGFISLVIDSEGNMIGIHSMK
jgi:predicted enzyme related to lactoylglutathione lyase